MKRNIEQPPKPRPLLKRYTEKELQDAVKEAVKAERERIEKEVREAQLVPEYSWVYQIIKGSPS